MAKNIFILISFILVFFYPCLKADFINWDDDGHILKNTAVYDLSPNSIKQIFSQAPNKTYIPLTILSFAIEKHFFGFNPFVFHLDNLLLYIGVAILVLLLARRMGLSLEASFLAAIIFALHPMRVETVAWVTERKDVLYALFYLLALHQYWSYLKTRSIRYYLSAIILGVISILAKPMALSLPLILLVLDWFYGRRFSKRVLIEKIPFLVYVICIAWITCTLNMRQVYGQFSFQWVLVWIWSLCFYFWKFFFPFRVSPYYVLPHPVNIGYWPYFLSVGIFLGLIYLLVRFKKNKLFIFAFLYFFFSIFFFLGLDERVSSVVSDRFMFLPSLGICFFVGAWIARSNKTRWVRVAFYLLLILMGIKTNFQCRVWHDSISFWNEIIRDYPDYYMAYNNRGNIFSQQKQYDFALKDYIRAISLSPIAARAYNNMGIIYFLKGDNKSALNDFNKVISIFPNFAAPYLNRSILKAAEKDYQQALQDALYAKKLGGPVDGAYLNRLQEAINLVKN